MADAGASAPGFIPYLKTPKGTLLAAEAILCVVILICYAASWNASYLSTPIVELIFCTLYFCIFMNQWDRTIPIHWPWSDLIRAVIGSVCFFITSIIVLTYGDTAGVTGGIFGLLAGLVFAYDSSTIIKAMKRKHEEAQLALVTTDHAVAA